MTMRFRRPLLVLGITILGMQAISMPVGMVYAETMIDTEEQEKVELPSVKNYLEEQVSAPNFSFTRSRMQGTVEELIKVTFFSDQEVSEARVFLPEEAILLSDQLPTGISVEEGEQPNEWIVQSKRAQNTFVLPIVFDTAGNYELSVEEAIAHLEISEQEETIEAVLDEEEIHHQTESSTENINQETNNQTWTGTQLKDFPLTIGYMGEMLRPELIPADVKVITANNSNLASNIRWVVDGVPLGSNAQVRENSRYSITDIDVEGISRRIDISFTPKSIFPTNLYTTSARAAWISRSAGEVSGEIKTVYSDDGTDVEGTMLVVIGNANNTNHYFNKEDLKGIVVGDFNGAEAIASITEMEDGYILNNNNSASFVGVIVPTSYSHRWTTGASTTYNFFRSLPDALSDWDPNFDSLELTGLQEEQQFSSKYELIQNVPNLGGGEYKVTLADNLDILKKPIITVINDDGNEVSAGSLVENDQGQSEILFSSEEIAAFRGERLKILIDYPLVTAKQSALEDYLNEEGYVSVPLTAKSNKGTDEVSAIAQTWVRPCGEAISREIDINTSTNELDPSEFVGNLNNKLQHDEPFVVGFNEERTFSYLGETSIGVVIESEISGIQNTIEVPVTVIENKGNVFVHYLDREGSPLADTDELIGKIGEVYETHAKEIENYHVVEEPDNAIGVYEDDPIEVTYIYDITPVTPVDPLDPEVEVDPENKPELPEDQGLLSIDFISSFNFGSQAISVRDQTYYAQPQRLLNEDGTVNKDEERPNYVQISDRRSENDRNGWQVAVTQNKQFEGQEDQQLTGASLSLLNQQLVTAQGGTEPSLKATNPLTLVPGDKRTLIRAEGTEGTGTWIYRFGDGETAGESVALDVPRGANPEATTYSSTLIWELSAVPGN